MSKAPFINFLGDSITWGVGLTNPKEETYCHLFCQNIGARENNYGVSGTRIARQIHPDRGYDFTSFDLDFNLREPIMDKDVIFTFVYGGTNDYEHGDAPIGKETDDSVYTFWGAMKTLVASLKKDFGEDKLCFLLPSSRFEEGLPGKSMAKNADNSGPLETYRAIMRKCLDENGIYYIDLGRYFPIPEVNGPTEFTVDGLHLNKKGHERLAEILTKYWQMKFPMK